MTHTGAVGVLFLAVTVGSSTFLAEEEGKAAPKDGQFPLLTIIRSLESR